MLDTYKYINGMVKQCFTLLNTLTLPQYHIYMEHFTLYYIKVLSTYNEFSNRSNF